MHLGKIQINPTAGLNEHRTCAHLTQPVSKTSMYRLWFLYTFFYKKTWVCVPRRQFWRNILTAETHKSLVWRWIQFLERRESTWSGDEVWCSSSTAVPREYLAFTPDTAESSPVSLFDSETHSRRTEIMHLLKTLKGRISRMNAKLFDAQAGSQENTQKRSQTFNRSCLTV